MAEQKHFFALVVLALTLSFLIGGPRVNAADCTFVLGFQAIRDRIPEIVGDCLVDQHYNPSNGDALQETTGGMLVWRKADNFTAFTDGYQSWVNGPYGLQQRLNTERFDWEAAAPEPTPTPSSEPSPTSIPVVTPTPPVAQSYDYYVLPRISSPLVLPGGVQFISARLTVPNNYNAPPVVGAIATFRHRGISFDVPTGPDGWATAIIPVPDMRADCFDVTISYNGHAYTVPGWELGNRCWNQGR